MQSKEMSALLFVLRRLHRKHTQRHFNEAYVSNKLSYSYSQLFWFKAELETSTCKVILAFTQSCINSF